MQANSVLWHNGWYAFAKQLPSPNYNERPVGLLVDLVVIHSISLPPRVYSGSSVQEFFLNQLDIAAHPYFQAIADVKVSAHFFIRRQGELLQFVSTDDRAWHAGQSSHLNRANCNDYSIGIELEGVEGECFEWSQYESLATLLSALADRYPIRYLASHEHIAPDRKSDPGSGFDWACLQRMLGGRFQCFP